MSGLERLKVLADFLESDAVPEDGFDMGLWHCPPSEDCGTCACAFGWACTIPSLQQDGLQIQSDDGLSVFRAGEGDWTDDGFDVAAKFFRLNIDETLHLFGAEEVEQPKSAVVARIREFIASKEGQTAHG